MYPINWLQALKMKVIGVNLVKKLAYLDASCEKCIRLAESQSPKPCKVHASTCLQEKPYLKKKKSADNCSSPSVLWFRGVFCFAAWLDNPELGSLTTDGSVSQLGQMSQWSATVMDIKQPWRYQEAHSPRIRKKSYAGFQASLPLSSASAENKLTEVVTKQPLHPPIILSEDWMQK